MDKPFSAYDGDDPYVFVCYAHANAEIVYPEIRWLRDQGVNIWYDEGISPGREFPETLGQAILGATAVLFYVSAPSVASRHCRDEVYFALDRDTPVIASQIEETELPPGLALSTGTTQAIQRWQMDHNSYREKLLAALTTDRPPRPHFSGDAQIPAPRRFGAPGARKWAVTTVVIAVCVLLGTSVFRWFDRQADIRWAKSQIPEIERLVEESWRDFMNAYTLAVEVEQYIPDDAMLVHLIERSSLQIDINSNPAGADVYVKPYRSPDEPWTHIGVTPIEAARMPIGVFRWKLEKQSYNTVFAAASTWRVNDGPAGEDLLIANDFSRSLDAVGEVPDGMVRVPGRDTPDGSFADFLIDRFEVTNEQYQQFVDAGAYASEKNWLNTFVRNDEVLDWAEAMELFVDQTGRPGPAHWQAGTYPDDEADYPVTGVSWYEAAAYAVFVGRSLPTGAHWGLARGEYTELIQWPQLGGYSLFAPFSNFTGSGPVEVGSLAGLTSFGAFDMAGNVREWCWNQTSAGRLVRGGSWGDSTYRFTELSQSPPFERSPKHGFRTVLIENPGAHASAAFARLEFGHPVDYYAQPPIADEIYEVYKEQFDYDHTALNIRLEMETDSESWVRETVTFDAAYADERVMAHLFLPKNASPPFQTVVYFPGSAALYTPSSENFDAYYEVPVFLSFLIKNGRAVLFPVYKVTFERGAGKLAAIYVGDETHQYSEWLAQIVKDLRRSIDYLETREDIDTSALVYYGMSWGALLGPIIPAVEDRVKASMIIAGGLVGGARPESSQITYVTRVTTPMLMLHGRFDTIVPFDTSAKPMFDLLGTPDELKTLKVYDTDHIPPRNEFIKETLAWLDRHQGPVTRAPAASGL